MTTHKMMIWIFPCVWTKRSSWLTAPRSSKEPLSLSRGTLEIASSHKKISTVSIIIFSCKHCIRIRFLNNGKILLLVEGFAFRICFINQPTQTVRGHGVAHLNTLERINLWDGCQQIIYKTLIKIICSFFAQVTTFLQSAIVQEYVYSNGIFSHKVSTNHKVNFYTSGGTTIWDYLSFVFFFLCPIIY